MTTKSSILTTFSFPLHLVDLAGSERVVKTGVTGQLLTEAKYINLSLHYLEQVIVSLTPKSNHSKSSSEDSLGHIPYRNSMMTSILRDSLGGNCKTSMIATLSIEMKNIQESVSTCRFAQRVALVKNKAAVNEVVDMSVLLDRQSNEIARLKNEIRLLNGGEDTLEFDKEELISIIQNFIETNAINNSVTEQVGPNLNKLEFCYRYFKKIFLEKQGHGPSQEVKDSGPGDTQDSIIVNNIIAKPSTKFTDEEIYQLKDLLIQRDNEINVLINMLRKQKMEQKSGLISLKNSMTSLPEANGIVGVAEQSSSASALASGELFNPPKKLNSTTNLIPQHMSRNNQKQINSMSIGRKEAFNLWKTEYTESSNNIYLLNKQKANLQEKYSVARSLGTKINSLRGKISQLIGQLQVETDENLQNELRVTIENNRLHFQEAKAELADLKPQVEHEQHLHEKTKKAVLEEFNEWFESEEASRVIESRDGSTKNLIGTSSSSPGIVNGKTFVVKKEGTSAGTGSLSGRAREYNPNEYKY